MVERTITLSPLQARRYRELQAASVRAAAALEEAVNLAALGVIAEEELPQCSAAYDGASTITVTVQC